MLHNYDDNDTVGGEGKDVIPDDHDNHNPDMNYPYCDQCLAVTIDSLDPDIIWLLGQMRVRGYDMVEWVGLILERVEWNRKYDGWSYDE